MSVSQPHAFGEGSFTPSCNRLPNGVTVTVPAVSGAFQTGPAEAHVVLVVGQGPNKRAEDSAALRVRPSVSLTLADHAILQGDSSVLIDVTVTCPMSAVGRGGQVRVYDGRIVGTGTFGPTPCDALPHTVTARVASTDGSFLVGSAEASAWASIEEGGDLFVRPQDDPDRPGLSAGIRLDLLGAMRWRWLPFGSAAVPRSPKGPGSTAGSRSTAPVLADRSSSYSLARSPSASSSGATSIHALRACFAWSSIAHPTHPACCPVTVNHVRRGS